eukprot:m.319796 g.319796  ORF g.319796 m.319796 type:complete len:699 (-) comp23463_c1_seq1:74-2170(-)
MKDSTEKMKRKGKERLKNLILNQKKAGTFPNVTMADLSGYDFQQWAHFEFDRSAVRTLVRRQVVPSVSIAAAAYEADWADASQAKGLVNVDAMLFHDALILASSTEKKLLSQPIKTKHIFLTSDPQDRANAVAMEWGQYTVTLLCASEEEKDEWVEAFHSCLSNALEYNQVQPRRKSTGVTIGATVFKRASFDFSLPDDTDDVQQRVSDLLFVSELSDEEEDATSRASFVSKRNAVRRKKEAAAAAAAPSSEEEETLLVSAGVEQMVLQMVDGKLLLMAGTKAKLIEYLTSTHARGILCQAPKEGKDNTVQSRKVGAQALLTKTNDSAYQSNFLLAYRTFMSSQSLLAALSERFTTPDIDVDTEHLDSASHYQQADHQKNNLDTRTKTISVLWEWVNCFFTDFVDPAMMQALEGFLITIEQNGYDVFAVKCRECIAKEKEKLVKLNKTRELPVREKYGPVPTVTLHMDTAELAMQLTLYDSALFRRIAPVEFLNHVRRENAKAEGTEASSLYTEHLDEFIARFDKESYWVEAEVCAQETDKDKAAMISKFIQVAQMCLKLQNLFSVFAVVGGLNFPEVKKCKKALELVPKKLLRGKEKIENTLMDPTKNMKCYRELVLTLDEDKPMLPFLPVLLKDLFFVNEGNKDNVEAMINFDKLRMLNRHVLELKERNEIEYSGVADPGFQTYLAVACVDTKKKK